MAPPPLLGFNNNVRHRGRVFHIQTEDSGVRHARIVTHLFADGGRIVGTRRLDYSRYLGQTDMVVALRRLMKDQHKAMFLALRAGELDEEIDRIFPGQGALASEQPSPDAVVSPPVMTSQPAAGPHGPNGLQSLRVEVRELSRPDASPSASGSLGPPEPSQPDSSLAFVSGSLQAALAQAANGGRTPECDTSASHRRESDAGGDSRSVSSEGTRRAAVFGSGLHRANPSIFNESQGIEDSLGDAILSFLAEDGKQDG